MVFFDTLDRCFKEWTGKRQKGRRGKRQIKGCYLEKVSLLYSRV